MPHLKNKILVPRVILAAQMAAIAIAGFPLGLWQGKWVEDTGSYVAVTRMPLQEALRGFRTLGYPLMLKAVEPFGENYEAAPWMHFVLLCCAVFLLDAALRRFGVSPWQACVASSAFLYATLQERYYIENIATDYSAMVAAGATVGCLFWLAAEPKRVVLWCALAVCLALTYHIRPAYLFMVPLAPFLGILFRFLRARATGDPFVWKQFSFVLTLVSLTPYCAYCLLRLVVVGHFGLVSFGGYTLVGLAVELLDPATVEDKLPEQYRPLAREILSRREARNMPNAFAGHLWVNMRAYEDNYSPNVWQIALPAARHIYGNDRVQYNNELAAFSRHVIWSEKGKYLLWVAYSYPRAVAKLLYRYWFIWFFGPAAALLFLVRRWKTRSRQIPDDSHATAAIESRNIHKRHALAIASMLWLAIAYFFCSYTMVILSGVYCDSRYPVAAGAFVPSFIALVILRELDLIRHIARTPEADARKAIIP
jgi:hypothetical protein